MENGNTMVDTMDVHHIINIHYVHQIYIYGIKHQEYGISQQVKETQIIMHIAHQQQQIQQLHVIINGILAHKVLIQMYML